LDPVAIEVSSVRSHGKMAGAQPLPVDPTAPAAFGDQHWDGVPYLMVKLNRMAVGLTQTDLVDA